MEIKNTAKESQKIKSNDNAMKNLKKLALLTKTELINQDKQSKMFRTPSFRTFNGPLDNVPGDDMIFNEEVASKYRFSQVSEDPLPPVLVKLFNTKEPDPKIQEAMDKLESGRDSIE